MKTIHVPNALSLSIVVRAILPAIRNPPSSILAARGPAAPGG